MALINNIDNGNQQKSIMVDRGLFLVRYAAAKDQTQPPMVKVAVDPKSSQDVSFILYPDQNEPVLWQPDTCLVVRATAPAKLAVEVVPMHRGGSTAATVQIESLSQSKAASPSRIQNDRSGQSQVRGAFRVLGHLTGRGDITVNADEWLAGPSAPSRIEGISLDWPGRPSGLEIHYAVKTARPQPISGQTVELGAFAGTRGKAMPIVGLMLEISGPTAENYQLSVETIFLGSPTTRTTGKRIVVYGPTGREPLVGLRVNLSSERISTAAHTERSKKPQAERPKKKSRQSVGPIRVFRSHPKSKRRATA